MKIALRTISGCGGHGEDSRSKEAGELHFDKFCNFLKVYISDICFKSIISTIIDTKTEIGDGNGLEDGKARG